MRVLDLILLALKMLRTRLMRTGLTVLGVGVGIGTILFLVSLGYGLQRILLTKITSSDALLSLDVVSSNPEVLPLDPERAKEFAALENVVEVSPLISLPGRFSQGTVTGDVAINIIEPSFFRLAAVTPRNGVLFDDPAATQVVISSAAAKLFNFENDAKLLDTTGSVTVFIPEDRSLSIVDEFVLPEEMTVVGILDDDSVPFLFVPASHLGEVDIKEYAQIKVKVVASEKLEEVRSKILDIGFTVSALSDTIDQANKIFRIIQVVLALFGIVALGVSAIGMFNTMTIALLERTQEIGIFKALGSARHDISRLFLTESTLIGALGGIGGIILGVVGSQVFNLGLNFLAKALGGESITLFYTPAWFIITIAVFSAAVGFLTGIFPARRAARLNPLKALRYK